MAIDCEYVSLSQEEVYRKFKRLRSLGRDYERWASYCDQRRKNGPGTTELSDQITIEVY